MSTNESHSTATSTTRSNSSSATTAGPRASTHSRCTPVRKLTPPPALAQCPSTPLCRWCSTARSMRPISSKPRHLKAALQLLRRRAVRRHGRAICPYPSATRHQDTLRRHSRSSGRRTSARLQSPTRCQQQLRHTNPYAPHRTPRGRFDWASTARFRRVYQEFEAAYHVADQRRRCKKSRDPSVVNHAPAAQRSAQVRV